MGVRIEIDLCGLGLDGHDHWDLAKLEPIAVGLFERGTNANCRLELVIDERPRRAHRIRFVVELASWHVLALSQRHLRVVALERVHRRSKAPGDLALSWKTRLQDAP